MSMEPHAYRELFSTSPSCQLYFLPAHTAHFIAILLSMHSHFGKSVPEVTNTSMLLLTWLPRQSHPREREGGRSTCTSYLPNTGYFLH